MRIVKSWDAYFMDLATAAATRSKDPNTNVGAVIVDNDKSVIETGFNGFPPGVYEDDVRWTRPKKYDYVIHAEQNAIGRAAKSGKKVAGATIYVTHFPCKECAKMIIASGIKKVVAYPGDLSGGKFANDYLFVNELFAEAGVESFIIP